MTTETAPEPQRRSMFEHPSFAAIGTVGPVLVVAVGALFWLAGFMFRFTVMDAFGLSPSITSVSLHEMIAQGFVITTTGTIRDFGVYGPVAGLLLLVHLGLRGTLVDGGWLRRIWRGIAAFIGLITVFLLLPVFGATQGIQAGEGSIATIRSRVIESRCAKNCYLFDFGREKLVGIVLAQDDKTTVVLTFSGTWVMETPDLITVKNHPRLTATTGSNASSN